MSVSRLDSFVLANATAVTGEQPAANQFVGPVNGLVTLIVSGTATTIAGTLEVYDGTNWVAVQTSQVNITAKGAYNWTGAALGLRVNFSTITGGNVTVVAVFQDFVG